MISAFALASQAPGGFWLEFLVNEGLALVIVFSLGAFMAYCAKVLIPLIVDLLKASAMTIRALGESLPGMHEKVNRIERLLENAIARCRAGREAPPPRT